MSEKDTKERILDTAERLFSEGGFLATSLRAITTEAGVNLAAVNYHFGSKDELIRAVFARRADPVNRERLVLLKRCEEETDPEAPDLECVLRAFLWPPLRMAAGPDPGGCVMMRLMGRVFSEPDEHIEALFIERFTEAGSRFLEAFRQSLPHLESSDLSWRFLFTIGAMAHTMADRHKLLALSGGRCSTTDVDEALRQLVAFIAAGMRAASPSAVGGASR